MLETFSPLVEAARGIDLTDPARAVTELTRRFDPTSPAAHALDTALLRLLESGKIADRGAPPVRYGRVAKATPTTANYSIDVVHMSGPGPHHRHPNGEINYCIALEGSPTFVGHPPGWVLIPPASEHSPLVENGTMLIVYLLPGGAIEFL